MRKPKPTVVALVDTRRGFSDGFVPAGTLGKLYGTKDDTVLIGWNMKPQYRGDNRMSVHDKSEIKEQHP